MVVIIARELGHNSFVVKNIEFSHSSATDSNIVKADLEDTEVRFALADQFEPHNFNHLESSDY